MVQQQWELIDIVVASQRIDLEPRIFEAVWATAFIVADARSIWSNPIHLQVESTHILKMYDAGLTC
jgi:hypothetical protein